MPLTVWEDQPVVVEVPGTGEPIKGSTASTDPVAPDSVERVTAPAEVAAAVEAVDSKGAANTVAFDVSSVSGITSYFVICSAASGRQVKAIAEEVERRIGEEFSLRPITIEGMDTLEWVLINYGFFLVHVFVEGAREFYDLERLWRDAPRLAF
jgi:ribosome-associated protein